MFTCLLCQLSSGSSDMITTLECSEMLSGSSYLLIWSPGHLITVKKKKHHQSTTQLQIIWGVGPEAALAFSFPPAIAACNFINYICSSHKPYLMWGQGRLRVRSFTWGYTCKQKSGHGRRASFHHHHQSPSTRAGGWGVSAQPLSVPHTGKLVLRSCCTLLLLYLIIAVPRYCAQLPHTQRLRAATIASVRAVQTPLHPFSTRITIVPPSLPAPRSHAVGTQRQLQTVAQGLVNVSALWTHHRLHFELYTECYWQSWCLKVFFRQPVGCLLLLLRGVWHQKSHVCSKAPDLHSHWWENNKRSVISMTLISTGFEGFCTWEEAEASPSALLTANRAKFLFPL